VPTAAVTNQEQARCAERRRGRPYWLVHEQRYERTVACVSEALHAAPEPYVTLGPFVTPDGVVRRYRAWLVTASRPWQ